MHAHVFYLGPETGTRIALHTTWGARAVRSRMALSMSMYNIIYATVQHGGPPADGGHPGGRRTGRHPEAFQRALHYGWAYMLTLWGKEDTEEEAVPWELGNIKFQVG